MKEFEQRVISYFGEYSVKAWKSKKYFVAAFKEIDCIRLDIERNDHKPGISWDELRQIKIDCGFGDWDGVEFYPSEKDVIYTGNWRHLYLFQYELPLIRRN